MRKITFVLFLLAFLTGVKTMAQAQYGTWTSVGVEKKLGKWKLEADTEIRTIYYLRLINRWSIGLDAEYKIAKPLEVGLSYTLMNVLDQKYLNYQFRNRFNVGITGKQKWGRFDFSLSEGLQLTTKNASKRIDDYGNTDTYKINPALMWKNSMQTEYDIPKSKLTPGGEIESYYELNNPDGNKFDKLRYSLFLKYKINKHNSLKLAGIYNDELGSDDADYSGKYIVDLKFSHTLK